MLACSLCFFLEARKRACANLNISGRHTTSVTTRFARACVHEGENIELNFYVTAVNSRRTSSSPVPPPPALELFLHALVYLVLYVYGKWWLVAAVFFFHFWFVLFGVQLAFARFFSSSGVFICFHVYLSAQSYYLYVAGSAEVAHFFLLLSKLLAYPRVLFRFRWRRGWVLAVCCHLV